jgi:hypothetical protein
MMKKARTEKLDPKVLRLLNQEECRSIKGGTEEAGGLLAFPFIQQAMLIGVQPAPGQEPQG